MTTLTPEKLAEYDNQLRAEIVQRECVLASLKVLRGYQDRGEWPDTLKLDSFGIGLFSATAKTVPGPPIAVLSEPRRSAPPLVKVHPELKALSNGFGSNVALVRWAARRMTADFSLTDLAAFLQREGCELESPKISVVLARLKELGEINEIRRGTGPNPALFRKPANPLPFTSVHDLPAVPAANK